MCIRDSIWPGQVFLPLGKAGLGFRGGFFGGEPLMNFEVCKQLVAYCLLYTSARRAAG